MIATTASARPIVFVDSRVQDSATLLQDLPDGAEVIFLRADEDGLVQVAAALAERGAVSSVQIVAHGGAGDLWLGGSYLSAANLADSAPTLADIGAHIQPGGDLLLYACNTGAGEAGAQFVSTLAQLTGRDVAASSDRTGGTGDWDLEITSGTIDSAPALSPQAMAAYDLDLATWTVTNNLNAGVGSLRAALASAQDGDTITFSASMTVSLTSTLTIDKDIVIDGDLNNDGVADVTLDAAYRSRVVDVTSTAAATFDGLVITRGMAAGNGGDGGDDALVSKGGGIYNQGQLTLNNVMISANAASGGGGGGGVTPQYAGGGGGGGGAITGGIGGRGGDTLNSSGSAGSSGQGGAGGGFFNIGGRGGSSTGGAGGAAYPGYSTGSAGGTANSGSLSIGGGGGGDGYNDIGGAGGGAAGGIYNDNNASLTIIGNSLIANNVGAGGGGGGGGAGGGYIQAGGAGGKGVGAIWNKGEVQITTANFNAMTGNVGGSGTGGPSAGTAGTTPSSVANIFNDGGTLNTAYAPGPTASIVVADTALRSGESSLVTITFSEAVNNFDNTDLTVANGTLTNVSSSNGGSTWTAQFTPTANIQDTTNVIVLNNAGVQNGQGTAGVGSTPSNNFAIDTLAPTATSIVVADNALRAGETSLVTLTFSEAVTGLSSADLAVANGTLAGFATANGGITWTATLTPDTDVTDASNLITLTNGGVADLAGNPGSGTTPSNNYAIDTGRPVATSIVVADTALRLGETSLVTVTFTEAVTSFTSADLTVENGVVSALSSADGGITWTGTLTPGASTSDPTNMITLDNTGIIDLAGNVGTGNTPSNNYAIDTARPAAASIVVADTALRAGETSLVTITFTEAVSDFTTADLEVANGIVSGLATLDGGVTWSGTLIPNAAVSDTTNLIRLNNAGVLDAAGNAGTGVRDSNNYAIDTAPPTAGIVVADAALDIGETSLVTITFSEAVSGFTLADLAVANGTLAGMSSSDGGVTWTATLTPVAGIADATNVIVLDNAGVADAAGNSGTGTTESNNYAVATVVNNAPTGGVTISGTPVQGGVLTAANTLADGDGLGPITYQWQADGIAIGGATTGTLTLAEAQVGKAITVVASYVDGVGVAEAVASAATAPVANVDDAPTGSVTIGGTVAEGQVLTAANTLADADGLGIIGYQWQVDGADIIGATGNLLTLTAVHVGKAIGVVASYVDGHGKAESVSATPTAPVANLNDAPTGAVTITGILQQGQLLTAANTLGDADGLGTIGYRWQADGTDIAGATAGTFTLTEQQVGKVITVVAHYTDGHGTAETVTAAPTGVVANVNDLPTGALTIAGSANTGATLRVVSTVADADGLGPFTYQWQANGIDIADATGATLALGAAQLGQVITVVANYVDGHGTAETVTSGATAAVTDRPPTPPAPPAPPVQTGTVDGVTVATQLVVNAATGLAEQIVNVAITGATRPDDPNTPNATLADIPLNVGNGTVTAGLTVSLPVGSGFQSSGSATLLTNEQALLDLIARIESKTATGSAAQSSMTAQGSGFLDLLSDSTLLATRTLAPVSAPGAAGNGPIIISGNAPVATPGATAATAVGLVIDTSGLSGGAVLHLDNVEFAAIVGAATVRGGAGQNIVIGDDAAQSIVLGAEDDVLAGGGGNDVIGSAGGNDRLDGGTGNDIVFGGIGNDTLQGGTGNDVLQGGRSDQGRWDFYLNAQGQVVGMHQTALVDAAATETVTSAELNIADAMLGFARADQATLATASLLYHAAFDRTADLGGLNFWAQSGLATRAMVEGFMQSNEWKDGLGKLGDAEFVAQLYDNALGRASTDSEMAAALAQLKAAADPAQGRADVFDAVALGAAHRAAWQTAAGVALGGTTVTEESGWITGGGDDRLDGGAGSDVLVGGDGVDTVVYAGAQADYAFRLTSGGQVTVTDLDNGDVDRIVQIEQGAFSDGVVGLGFTQASPAQLQQLGLMYQIVLDRAGEFDGFGYWLASGKQGSELAGQFLESGEFQKASATLGDDAFVTLLYQNALGRTADADGRAYWNAFLDEHSRADMVAAWTASAEVQAVQYGTEGLWLA